MWIKTSEDRVALYNLSALEVVVALPGAVEDDAGREIAGHRGLS